MTKFASFASIFLLGMLQLAGCNNADKTKAPAAIESKATPAETPEYFNLRPKLEKEYGYTHAVKIGNDLKISGAVSMNDWES